MHEGDRLIVRTYRTYYGDTYFERIPGFVVIISPDVWDKAKGWVPYRDDLDESTENSEVPWVAVTLDKVLEILPAG